MTAATTTTPGLLRKGFLAWLGAIVLIQDELETGLHRLIERGELAEAEGRKLVADMMAARRRPPVLLGSGCEDEARAEARAAEQRAPAKAVVAPLHGRAVDWVLRRLGRPTRAETRRLQQRIHALEERLASLALADVAEV